MPLSFSTLLGILMVGLSCILAMSRGFILAFVVSTVLLLSTIKILRKKGYQACSRYIARTVVILSLAAIVAMLLQLFGFDLWGFFSKRIELATQTPRFAMWSHLISGMKENWNPLFGAGLRGAQETLGGLYSHNSYFDVLYETGLPGFALWLSTLGYVTVIALGRIRNVQLLPWIQTWLVLLVMFGAFSLVYNPFPWLIAGVLCASPLKCEGCDE